MIEFSHLNFGKSHCFYAQEKWLQQQTGRPEKFALSSTERIGGQAIIIYTNSFFILLAETVVMPMPIFISEPPRPILSPGRMTMQTADVCARTAAGVERGRRHPPAGRRRRS
jgi:hypothetical protein